MLHMEIIAVCHNNKKHTRTHTHTHTHTHMRVYIYIYIYIYIYTHTHIPYSPGGGMWIYGLDWAGPG